MFRTSLSFDISIVRIWDVRPYAPTDRQLKLFLGAQHGYEKVSLYLVKCVIGLLQFLYY